MDFDSAPGVRSRMTGERSKILVVDDDDQIREMLCYMLKQHGFEAVGAPDGSDGLTKACATAFDVVALDNMMPGMSGEQLARRLLLLECAKRSQIIMITGGLISDQASTFAAMTLKKPFEMDDLLAAIERVVAG